MKLLYFFCLVLLFSLKINAQDQPWSDWIPLNSYLEARAKVAQVETDHIGYKWEFKLREKLFKDDPALKNQTIYVRVEQSMPIHLTGNKGDYHYDAPLRFLFSPNAHTIVYSPQGLFWMPKAKKNDFEEYTWQEGQIFPIATRGDQKFYHWGASLKIDQVNSENMFRFSQEKGYANEYINVN